MKTLIRMIGILSLLAIGFASGFPVGSTIGFTRGSEWALVQAGVLAREAGLFMPVLFEDGIFKVIMKQPRGLYQRAWKLADGCDETVQRIPEKTMRTDEIIYASHDKVSGAEPSLQEVGQQTTENAVLQDPAALKELSSQESRLQGADEVASPEPEMPVTATSAPTSITM